MHKRLLPRLAAAAAVLLLLAGPGFAEPPAEPADGAFRLLPRLRVAPGAVAPIPVPWAVVSLLPGAEGEPPNVLVQGAKEWIDTNHVLHRPADAATRRAAGPTPDPDLPLYAAPEAWDRLPRAQHQAVRRAGGAGGAGGGAGWDLYNLQKLARVAAIGPDGVLKMLPRPEPLLTGPDAAERKRAMRGGVFHLADADGDGVTDLLVTRQVDRAENKAYWPRGEGVWSRTPLPHVGPHADLDVTDGFRGYGIDGRWLGSLRTKELGWCRGTLDGSRLTLGEHRPVYSGRDDFPVQWRGPERKMEAAVIVARPAGGGPEARHVVLFSGNAEALAMPVLDTPDAPGDLHLGRAHGLLSPDTPKRDLFIPVVRGTMDLTGDGRDDVVIGSGANGRIAVVSGDRVGRYEVLGTLQAVGGPLAAGTLTVPARGDWDGDGRPDLVTGDAPGYYLLWPGTDDPLVYGGARAFVGPDGEPLVFKGEKNLQGPNESGWSYSQPTLSDWDGDGRLDLIGNDNTNTLRLHRRADGAGGAGRAEPWVIGSSEVFTHAGHKLGVAWRSRVAVVPGDAGLAGDDRPVLLFLDLASELKLGVPASAGSTEIERILPLRSVDGSPIVPAGSAGMSGRTRLSAPDWDGDGVWDVLLSVAWKNVPLLEPDPRLVERNRELGTCAIYWLRNAGTASEPVFEAPRRLRHADGAVLRVEKHALNAEPTDLDGDGRLDLLFGDGPGFVYHLMRDELAWD